MAGKETRARRHWSSAMPRARSVGHAGVPSKPETHLGAGIGCPMIRGARPCPRQNPALPDSPAHRCDALPRGWLPRPPPASILAASLQSSRSSPSVPASRPPVRHHSGRFQPVRSGHCGVRVAPQHLTIDSANAAGDTSSAWLKCLPSRFNSSTQQQNGCSVREPFCSQNGDAMPFSILIPAFFNTNSLSRKSCPNCLSKISPSKASAP